LLRDLGDAQSASGFEFIEEAGLFQQRERVIIGGTQQAHDARGFFRSQRYKRHGGDLQLAGATQALESV